MKFHYSKTIHMTMDPKRIRTAYIFLTCVIVCALCPIDISAEVTEWYSFGLKKGLTATRKQEHFEQFELSIFYDRIWNRRWFDNWTLRTRLGISLGDLVGGGINGNISSFGPGIIIDRIGVPYAFNAGINVSLLEEYQYGREHFGGMVQFSSYIGFEYTLDSHFTGMYRFQHMSNSSIYRFNPGLNLHIFMLCYRL